MQDGKLAQARAFFNRAASQSPQDVVARVNLARADARLGNLNEAIDHLQSAIALDPNEADLHVELGELYFQASQPVESARSADAALNLDPRSAKGWGLKGKLSHAARDYQSALLEYQRSLSYPSTDGSSDDKIQLLMAQVYQQLGKPTRALSTVEQLLSRYPRDRQPETALLVKAKTLMSMDQPEPAMDVLAIACNRSDASLESFLRLGEAQLINGRRFQAQQTLARAKEQYPDDPVLIQLDEELRIQARAVVASQNGVPASQTMVR